MKLRTLLLLGAFGTAAYLVRSRRRHRPGVEADNTGTEKSQFSNAVGSLSSAARRAMDTVRSAGKSSGSTSDSDLQRHVAETLALNPHFVPGRMWVSVRNGRVRLEGSAETGEDIRQFEQSARKVPGVRGVENLLHLQGAPRPTSHQAGLAPESIDQAVVGSSG